MKRFFIFILVLGVALLGLYVWWQRNATTVIQGEVQRLANGFFVDAKGLKVTNDPVKMTGTRTARIPKLVIEGNDLELRNGLQVAFAKIVLNDVDLTGPPFGFSGVKQGYYTATVTQEAVTYYLHKRGISFHGLLNIPLDTINVSFQPDGQTVVAGQVVLPIIKKAVPITATGKLVASSKNGEVDFRITSVKALGGSTNVKQLTDALGMLNPMISVADWSLMGDLVALKTGRGAVTLRGRVTGVQDMLLP